MTEHDGYNPPPRRSWLQLLGPRSPRGILAVLGVSAATVVGAIGLLVFDPFGLFGPNGEDSSGRMLPMSLQEYAQRFPKEVRRLVYPNSVVPGGISSAEDAKRAAQSDPVVRQHYRGINLDKLRPVVLGEDRTAYVSYRKGDKIFWTSKKIHLFKGETVLTDGNTLVRARCGNLISDAPMAMASLQEPPEDVLNSPVLPTGPLALLETPEGLGPLAAPGAPDDPAGEGGGPLPTTPNTVIAQAPSDSPAMPGTPGGPGGGTSGGGRPPGFNPPGTPYVGAGAPPSTTPGTPTPDPPPSTPNPPGGTTPDPPPSTPGTTPPPSTPGGPGTPPSTPGGDTPGAPPATPPGTPTPTPTPPPPPALPPTISPPPSIPGGGPPVPPFTPGGPPSGPGTPTAPPGTPVPNPPPTDPLPPLPPPVTPPDPPSAVPEPSTWLLVAFGCSSVAWMFMSRRWKLQRERLARVRLRR